MTETLLALAEEKVVGRIGYELSLAHRASGSRDSSPSGIQALDERGFEQEIAARGPLSVPD